MKRYFLALVAVAFMLFSLSFVSAVNFDFNGTIKDTDGNPVEGANVSLKVINQTGWSTAGYNSNLSTTGGYFNLTVTLTDANYVYEVSIINRTGTFCNLRSKSLPSFPQAMIQQLAGTTFYLSPAGNLNITAVNASGVRTNFTYQIKDTKLGYAIAEDHSDWTNQQTFTCVPRDRNYTIMMYPYQSMPVSFAWNNFSATQNYNISAVNNNSFYNVTSRTLHKQFNLTMNMARVTGYINNSDVKSWNSIEVNPYILEGGNMVHAQYGAMPYNLSSMVDQSDIVNISAGSGTYNITLPATVETNNVLIFIAATNTSAGVTTYYGGFRNISLSYGTTDYDLNFTMYGLLGSATTITLDVFGNPPTNKNITTAKQLFTLINSSNSTLASTQAHTEVRVDYSSFAALGNNITTTSFTWMTDVAQSQALANFSIPLLNITGVKEMNVFVNGGPSGGNKQYAPKRKTFSVVEIQSNSNITISTFNPGAIDSSVGASLISMALYFSNATCDVPNPPAACLIGGGQTMASFNPMQAVMGGGKLSFRMGYGGILVHYVNVDLLASGPPDALFDSSATTSAGATGFASAMRFGSQGPTIYDYVLISMPYTEGGRNGLKDNIPVSMSIPILYDDSWNIIWNVSANGTSAASLAASDSHYSTYQNAWANLTIQKVCETASVITSSMMNETNPCFIDTQNNRIWIRLPHFTGTGPSINGSGSADSYTVSGAVEFLSPTQNNGAYINQNQIIINVTTNLSDFQNLTIFVYNHSNNFDSITTNLSYNSSDPTYYLNYSGLADGMYSFNVSAVNSSGFRNSSVLRNVTLDTVLPFIINGSRTEVNGSYVNRNWIYFNVSIDEINPANITLYLYNSTLTLINTTSYSLMANSSLNLNNNTINWTGLANGIYYYNSSITDKAGNKNKTVMRMVTIDAIDPNIIITSPVNLRTYYSNQTVIISFNASDTSPLTLTFANATANITYIDKNWTRFTSAGWYNLTFYANDSASRMSTTLVSFNVINQPANVAIANTSTFDANATGTNIIVPYNSSLQNLTINSTFNATGYSFNLSQILISGNAVIGGLSNITLIRADSGGGLYNYTVFIQDNSNISGGGGWDGSMAIPIVNMSAIAAPSGTVDVIISVGSSITELNLTKPAKITFIGLGGKSAAWAKTGVFTLTAITTACNSNITIPTNIDATTTRECYISAAGGDLIIWTYHFSSFAVYTLPTAAGVVATSSSSSAEELFWKITYYPADNQLSSGYSKDLAGGNRIRFKINNTNHYVGVVSVDSVAKTALMNISSTPQQKVMAVGEEWKADVTDDNYYDILVKLDNILGAKASITVTTINEVIPAAPAEIPSEETSITGQIEEKIGEVIGKWSPVKKIIVSIGILLALAVLVIGIIILIQKIKYSKS